MTYPQPHERIFGIDRSDDPLMSLEDSALKFRSALIALTWHAHMESSRPGSTFWSRMNNPQLGDLVMETTSLHRSDDLGGQNFGYLLDHRKEWIHTDDEWAEVAEKWGNDRPIGDYWHIQYGSNAEDVCRWENCRFIAVPAQLRLGKSWR